MMPKTKPTLSLFYLKAICIIGCQNMQPKFPFNDQEDYVPILLKKLIFPANFVLIFFLHEILINFVIKKNCRKLLPIFLQNILYKKLFVTNFVENTCEFYNFVGNNYPWRNYLPIKILRINSRKKIFSCKLLQEIWPMQRYYYQY